ncbi:MAG: MiaB/RimO family radical SAM methylthiotransferase, partial [Spirochaetia bacterium]|nr:MiaB/RimO family radical SAM methylthiotransferase [Spirochaetia bacterium]
LAQPNEIADIYIINTCTVTTKAEQKARRMIRKYHRENKEAIIIVTGCYAQMEEELIKELIDRVVVVSLEDKPKLLTLAHSLGKRMITDIDLFETIYSILKEDNEHSSFDYDAASFSLHSRAFLKIQDGCDNSCGYCRVTIARGNSVSLPYEEVVERCRALESTGYKEIVLTGVNISQYKDGEVKLEHLLTHILSSLSPFMRIRLSSLEPDCFSDGLLEVLKDYRIQPHFHLPLQSLSNSVLNRINRHYDYETVQRALSSLREVKENPFIAGDMITGLPGEGIGEFNESYERLKELHINQIHVFPYSPRPSTPLFGASDPVPEYLRDERASLLRTLSVDHTKNYIISQRGKIVDVIIEKIVDNKVSGISGNYLKLMIKKAPSTITQGALIKARIDEKASMEFLCADFLELLHP